MSIVQCRIVPHKIEAKEACDWLRAAGLPQYVHLFRECKFPVDIECVKRDHHFLDKDALDSLCRRLNTLNKCAEMRLELRRSKHRGEDCDEEDFCAISPSWTYDRQIRQWHQLDSTMDFLCSSSRLPGAGGVSLCDVSDDHDICSIHSSSSTESEGPDGHHRVHRSPAAAASTTVSSLDEQDSSRGSSISRTLFLEPSFCVPLSSSGSSRGSSTKCLEGSFEDKQQRKKGTNLLRKMEILRLRGASALLPSAHGCASHSERLAHRAIRRQLLVQEGDPEDCMVLRMQCPSSLQDRSSSHNSSLPSSPNTMSSSSSNSHSESSSTMSTPSPVTRIRSNCKRTNSGCGTSSGPTQYNQSHGATEDFRNQRNVSSQEPLVFQIPDGHKPGTFPTSLARKHPILSRVMDSNSINWRTGSFHGYQGRRSRTPATSLEQESSCDVGLARPPAVPDYRLSIYDNLPHQQLSGSESSSVQSGGEAERMDEKMEVTHLMAAEDVFSALDSVLERINDLQQLVSTWCGSLSEDDCARDSSSSSSSSSTASFPESSGQGFPCPSSPSYIHLEVQNPEKTEGDPVTCEKKPENGDESTTSPVRPRTSVSQQLNWSRQQNLPPGPGVENQSVSQFIRLQKLSLLKLTALMDKYSPSSKQGWNWTVPKPTRKSKVVELKTRRVFGVPLLLSVQQTGSPLPPSILKALEYLRNQCLNQVGLFRKSGVKSRIQYLRDLVESDPDGVTYDGQSAYDVADMVKQYFRDLPEPVFTSKLCESFLHIYQYFPKDQQLVAAQAAILLLPDENREALHTLLFFLHDVVTFVEENQMTPTNVAVCLAPSLFHLSTLKANTARSSQRKYSLGRPDQRDLSENLAAAQGLANMITEAVQLFQLPQFWPGLRLSDPTSAEDILTMRAKDLTSSNQRGDEQEEKIQKLKQSTQLLLKEAQEKNQDWESCSAKDHVDLSFKKMNDGCPLWMWRGSVEVDAPLQEVLHRLMWEQDLWDRTVYRTTIVQNLSKDTEVYHYILHNPCHGLAWRPSQEHLLLRTWQADPSCGPVYLSSVSTEDPRVPAEGVRAHVHACLYLLEPAGTKKTRLTHFCRTDTRGRSQEWHNKVSGHRLSSGLLDIRNSFRTAHRHAIV